MQHDDKPAGLGCTEQLGQVPTRAALDDLAAQALAQMDKARDFPANTCSASRHLAEIAEVILRGQPCHQLTEDPQHCAESMAWTVASLWYARTEIERLRDLLARVADEPNIHTARSIADAESYGRKNESAG